MKNLKSLLCIFSVCIFYIGCTNDELESYESNTNTSSNSLKIVTAINMPILSKTSLIIKYKTKLSDNFKKNLRNKFGVKSYQKCNCSNTLIEQWTFDLDTDIEGRKGEITQEGVGIEGVDFQFLYTNQNMAQSVDPSMQLEKNNIELIKSSLNSDPENINIALLDTGIDLAKLADLSPKLYENSEAQICVSNGQTEVSGWDFINNDNNTYDDNGHGTAVTKILTNKLINEGIDNYTILPVKIFDKDGKGTTFTTICGYLYAVSKPNISVVNMSFGWYGPQSEILSQLILENPEVLNITSSGNEANNNDKIGHYPSSYPHENILSIGSINNKRTAIAFFSNYGNSSVDFLSLGDQVELDSYNGVKQIISGTSFAVPIVTAKSMLYINQGSVLPIEIREKLHTNGTAFNDYHLPIKFSDVIIE